MYNAKAGKLEAAIANHEAAVNAVEADLEEYADEDLQPAEDAHDGWQLLQDPASGQSYWLNESTGESVWAA